MELSMNPDRPAAKHRLVAFLSMIGSILVFGCICVVAVSIAVWFVRWGFGF
jgi:ABC-type uncharacterized transport system permease subunit